MRDALLLDLDDTLLDHRSASDAAVADWAPTVPGWVGEADQARAQWTSLEIEHFPRYANGECTLTEQRRRRVRGFSAALAEADETSLDALMVRYLEFYERSWQPVPGGASLIDRALAAGLRVGVLTNGEEDQQRRKLQRIGLARPELALFTSAGLGVAKPASRAFQLACERLGASPERTTMVGDNYAVDIIGARSAGLSAIHFDHSGAEREPGSPRTLAAVEAQLFETSKPAVLCGGLTQ